MKMHRLPTTLLLALCLPLLYAAACHAQPAVAEAPAATAATAFQLPPTDEGLPGEGPLRRADWFQDVWRERRSQWIDEVARDQGALVFLGDSITQGWGDISRSFPGLKAANRGISGDTTRGMLYRLQEDVLTLNPQGVVLLMGTNDLEEKATPETIAGNVKRIIEGLQSHRSDLPIILCSVFPSSSSKQRSAIQIKKLNNLCAAAVKGDPHIQVLDTWTLFANADGDAKPEEFPDLLHPNEVGYRKWANALRPLLETMEFIAVAPDDFAIEEGFEPLFNGTDLTGWGLRPTTDAEKKQSANWRKNDPNAPPWPVVEEPIDLGGKKSSEDGRYVARNERLVVTIPPEGRKIQQLWTTQNFPDDFLLKLEFRATPNADSGVFLRGKQLQCRDYATAGPYKNLKNYRPQDWNELVIRVTGNVAHCTCNGEVIEAAFAVPANGPIGLEGDRGQIEYRRLRIKQD